MAGDPGQTTGTLPRRSWWQALAVYGDRRMVAIGLLGFSSGLPLLLTSFTLQNRLKHEGVDLTTIGLFGAVGLPYALKFLWAPLVDRLPLPVLTRWVGRRRSWGLASQLFLLLGIFGLGAADPRTNGWSAAAWSWLGRTLAAWWGAPLLATPPETLPVLITAATALLVAICSATQDLAIDTWRVETLAPHEQGAGSAAAVFGYRVGMLVSGAGALYLSGPLGWYFTYAVMAGLILIGVGTFLFMPEPPRPSGHQSLALAGRPLGQQVRALGAWLARAYLEPLADFVKRPGWLAILLFVALFFLGESFQGVMTSPFYVAMGFTNQEIASITKVFGFGATILGGFLGGVLVARMNVLRVLLVTGVLLALCILLFAVLAERGHDTRFLMLAIGAENLGGGMATTAFVAYLSGLCHVSFTATQYALLTSLSRLARILLSSTGGWLVDQIGWTWYFVFCSLACIPGLLLLLWISRRVAPAVRQG